jgi:hypothetical protein
MKLKLQIKLNAYFSIIFGCLIVSGETYRRFGDFGHWSRWMDDYIIGLLLIVPAILILKGRNDWIKVLISGYGFATGLLYGSFFSKFLDVKNIQQSNIEADLLIFLIGLGLLASLVGLIWTLIIEFKRARGKLNKVPVANT